MKKNKIKKQTHTIIGLLSPLSNGGTTNTPFHYIKSKNIQKIQVSQRQTCEI
jgi:hypothetical protein